MEEIRCPRCASMNTAEIHYGPKDETGMGKDGMVRDNEALEEASERGWGPRFHCHDCRRSFGSASLRPEVLSDAENYRQASRRILFETGGLMQGFLTVKLEKSGKGASMKVSPGFTPDPESGEIQSGKVSITKEQWDRVVSALFEDLFVLDWKEAYENPFVMDGQQWRLEITMEDGEALRYHGMNGYPVYWDRVLELFDPRSIMGMKQGLEERKAAPVGKMTSLSGQGKGASAGSRHRFDNPERIAELDPVGTLERFGLKAGQTVCDIGAGTGAFTFPAASLTTSDVYAVDIDDEMLGIIRGKVRKQGTRNVIPIKGSGETLDVEDGSIDLALMVTVFHHISDKPAMLKEIRRVLTEDGRFGLIEFHDRETPSGPPVGNRIGKSEVLGFLEDAGFEEIEGFDIGENFYAKVFRVKTDKAQ